jgi:hypothetical protein
MAIYDYFSLISMTRCSKTRRQSCGAPPGAVPDLPFDQAMSVTLPEFIAIE